LKGKRKKAERRKDIRWKGNRVRKSKGEESRKEKG
jgi:hypothetical protein